MNSQYPKLAGIYKLTCIKNNKIYIGKSINISRRMSFYKYCENKQKGRCYLENAILKHGWSSFEVEILETFLNFDKFKDHVDLLKRESYFIQLFDSGNKTKGYNIYKISNDGTGVSKKPFSEEHKAKLRIARAKQIRGPLTAEHKEKIRKSCSGRVFSEEHKQKLKISKSETHKQKIGISNLGKCHSTETKEKMRVSSLGKRHSEKTKQKMRKSKTKIQNETEKQNHNMRIFP